MLRCKATCCETIESFGSRHDALAAGWAFVEIATKDRNRYHVFCPTHSSTNWLRLALANDDKPKAEKK